MENCRQRVSLHLLKTLLQTDCLVELHNITMLRHRKSFGFVILRIKILHFLATFTRYISKVREKVFAIYLLE